MDVDAVRCRSHAECEVHHRAHYAREDQLAERLRQIEKQLDTLGSPWWKRLWFRLDGWGPWWIVSAQRAWRPWHRK